jgi:uridine kinase
VRRDVIERGRDVRSVEAQYLGTVRTMHELHVAPTRRHAHLIIPEGGENTQALDVLIGHLLRLLSLAAPASR